MRTFPPLTLAYRREDWILPVILADRAGTHADKVYFREGEGRQRAWTYKQTFETANTIGHVLRELGYEPGDRLAIMMKNCPEYVLAWFGSAVAGVAEVPINPEYSGAFLEHSVNLMLPRGVVTAPSLVSAFVASAKNLPATLEFFVVDEGEGVDAALEELRRAGWSAERFEILYGANISPLAVSLRREDLGAIISTSGATGPSRGVMMCNAQLYFFAEQTKNVMRLTESDVMQLALPMFHGNAQLQTVYPALIAGASFVMYEKFSPTRFVSRVREAGITVANFVGVMLDWVWRQPATPTDADNALRCILSAPTPAAIAADFRKRFGVEATPENFGQTEICLPFLAPYGEERPAGAAGVLCDEFFDVRLVDPRTDQEVPIGQVGELVVRTKEPWLLTLGYWGMPQVTADTLRNQWFHTGDGLKRDEAGWYYFTDRIKDALRRRGENISAFEVEQAVLAHPEVAECAVIAVPSEYRGGEDEVMAVIALKGAVEPERVIEWCTARMPRFLRPRYWRVVAQLPRTPSKKVDKATLVRDGLTADTVDREPPSIGQPGRERN